MIQPVVPGFFVITKTQCGRIPFYRALQLSGNIAKTAQKLGISVTACSNRLNKLAEQGLIKKLEVEKPVGNEKYMYAWLF